MKHSVQSLCSDIKMFSSWSEMDSHILCLFQLCFCCCPKATGLQWSLISAYIRYWTKVYRAPPPSIGYDDKLSLPALQLVRLLRCSGMYQHCFIISAAPGAPNKLMLLLTNGTKRKQVIVQQQRNVCQTPDQMFVKWHFYCLHPVSHPCFALKSDRLCVSL